MANPKTRDSKPGQIFGFEDDGLYFVTEFDLKSNKLDLGGTAFYLNVEDQGVVILKNKPKEGVEADELLKDDGIFLMGISAEDLNEKILAKGSTLEPIDGKGDTIEGAATVAAAEEEEEDKKPAATPDPKKEKTTTAPTNKEEPDEKKKVAAEPDAKKDTEVKSEIVTAKDGTKDEVTAEEGILKVVTGFNAKEGDTITGAKELYAVDVDEKGTKGVLLSIDKDPMKADKAGGIFLQNVTLDDLKKNDSFDGTLTTVATEAAPEEQENEEKAPTAEPEEEEGNNINVKDDAADTTTKAPKNTAPNANLITDSATRFGAEKDDVADIAQDGTKKIMLNLRGGDDTLNFAGKAGTFLLGKGDDTYNIEAEDGGIINVMTGDGADVGLISGIGTVNVLLGGTSKNGDGKADTLSVASDFSGKINISQWDKSDSLDLGGAAADLQIVNLKNGMIRADVSLTDSGGSISVTMNAADRDAFQAMLTGTPA